MSNKKQLWEILIPTVRNDGRPFRLRFHRVWDQRVKDLVGGLTVITPVKGTWIAPAGEEFKERMIPVRIMCSRDHILEIAEFTKTYYEQKAVMIYRISDECMIV
jgi:hypothetical protein